MTTIESNLQAVRERIASACRTYARPAGSVALLAVSKTFGPEAVQAAYAAGQRAFGENYVQECVEKAIALRAACPGIAWHYIGPLQSNKTRLVAQHCDWVHSIDRLKIAERLSHERDEAHAPLQVCVQVNVSGEASKSGVAASDVHALVKAVSALPRLKLRGLMCIPEPSHDEATQRAGFAQMRELMLRMNNAGYALDTLSMGMSADMDAAIAEGATIVRVGTAIFGKRV